MRYVQLKAFHNVALHGGFSRAAQALGLTQPALSDQVRKLEQEYDILLFDRHRKQVVLTPQGRKLLAITRPLFEIEARAGEYLSDSRALSGGTLRVIADSPCHVTAALSRFRALHPGVRITLRSGNSQNVTDALASYEADIGVLGNFAGTAGLTSVALGASPIIAFARVGFGRAGAAQAGFAQGPGRPATLAALAKYPLVLREKGSKTRQKLEEAARAQGVRLGAAIEAEGREAVREIVASGAGIGFVSEAEYGCDARLVKIPISGPRIGMQETLVCVSHRQEVRLIRAFMALAGAGATAQNRAACADIPADIPTDIPTGEKPRRR